MSRGYGIALCAVGLALILSTPALGQTPEKPHNRPPQNQNSTAEKQPNSTKDSPIKPPSTPSIFKAPISPPSGTNKNEKPPAQKGEKPPAEAWNWNGLITTSDTLAQWLMMFFALGATVISGFALWFLWKTAAYTRDAAQYAKGMLKEARETTTAAKASVEQAREALLTTDRAWVKVDAEITDSLIFERDEISVKIRAIFTNIGRSPASHISIFFEIFPDIIDAGNRAKELTQNEASKFSRLLSQMGYGRVLFPDDPVHHELLLKMPIRVFRERIRETAENIRSGENFDEADIPTTAFPAVLIGVRYLLPSDEKFRSTYVPFEIRKKDADHRGWDGTEDVVWPDDLVLEQFLMTGWVT